MQTDNPMWQTSGTSISGHYCGGKSRFTSFGSPRRGVPPKPAVKERIPAPGRFPNPLVPFWATPARVGTVRLSAHYHGVTNLIYAVRAGAAVAACRLGKGTPAQYSLLH